MTKLREYLFYKNISITSFSEIVGITRTYMNSIVLGRHIPSRILAREISRATNGEVSVEDIRPED